MIVRMAVTLYTTSQVAEAVKVDPSTIRVWAIEGRIPYALKTPGGHYRFDLDEVRTALAKAAAA